jgi:exodeoxyribonuclease V alpha subunit
MRTENDYSEETGLRANGETAEIQTISSDGYTIGVKYHDETDVKLDSNELENGFDLAYALTVHKAQGSQYDNIVIFIDNAQSCWDKQTLYTAISRAVNRCIIVTSYDNYLAAQRRNNNSKISLFLEMFSKYEFD